MGRTLGLLHAGRPAHAQSHDTSHRAAAEDYGQVVTAGGIHAVTKYL